jgi:glyoxylase-like metal-dependent hydrolase (beta-lactamase superfamily II)
MIVSGKMKHQIKTRKGTLIEVINAGNFLLDGGTMFGKIPKTMWQEWFPADEKNRIVMATNVVKIFKDRAVYQIDAGLGSQYSEKEKKILGITENIVLKGFVDYLMFTHLHFDHCGGISDLDVSSDVFVSRIEWDDAHDNSNPLIKGSYRRSDLDAIKSFKLIEPPFSVASGIEVLPTQGHTRGHVSVLIDEEIFYPGDLIPTAAHVHLPCIMAYDLFPLEIIETKKKMLDAALEREWIVVFEHDPYTPFARIDKKGGRYTIRK